MAVTDKDIEGRAEIVKLDADSITMAYLFLLP